MIDVSCDVTARRVLKSLFFTVVCDRSARSTQAYLEPTCLYYTCFQADRLVAPPH
ncbi:hypothetical protein [Roseiconus lacunae]|uniref:hypothetical protein n=1 Tax=Roseiconus lacunae TaxID=2605694 RepID=UPI001E34D80D|nr:hypothetical protein [Roseiconus lacunae]